MNPILLRFADGTTFFVGLALVLGAEALLFRFHTRVVRPVLTVLPLVGAVLVVISATPLPMWMYIVWGITALAGLVLGNRSEASVRSRWVAGASLLVSTAGFCLAELPHRSMPHLVVEKDATVYVIGDSISAGIGTTERCWPAMLEEITGLRAVNLAQPGAKVANAAVQAKRIVTPNSVVIVEIGGNDLLGGTDAAAFRDQLDSLISSLRAAQHQILIIELPLIPFMNAFGQAQRSIVSKHGAALLPKRVFAKVLGTRNGTLDGLHLSQEGHSAMARSIAGIMQREPHHASRPTGSPESSSP
jgi:acyl-CoA thioesterase-1